MEKLPNQATIKGTPALKDQSIKNQIGLYPGMEVLYFIKTIFVGEILDKRVVFIKVSPKNQQTNAVFVPLYLLNLSLNQKNELLSKPTKIRKKDFETVLFPHSEVEEYEEIEIEE